MHPNHLNRLPVDLLQDLQHAGLEILTDPVTRTLYSTDASIYQIEPLGVAFPRTADHLNAAVELADQYNIPIIARGAGSGLAGQSLGTGLILDCSRHLNKILEIDPALRTVTVQPGMVLDNLNRAVGEYGLQFGPDPASSERATIGGSLSNNATGAHSIQYGMSSDHILEVEAVLGDGSIAVFGERTLENVAGLVGSGTQNTEYNFYRTALEIREKFTDIIHEKWARVWRRASGYSLNYLLPWSTTKPPQWSDQWSVDNGNYPPIRPGHINLAPLFAGAEGTLGLIRQAKVGLVQKPRYSILGILAYASIAAACDDTPRLLEYGPSAIELIPRRIVQLARAVPAYGQLIDFLPPGDPDPAAMLVIEFVGDSPDKLKERVKVLGSSAYVAESHAAQARIWRVRKVGLGLLMSKPGNAQPIPFIEDIAVPVEKLGDFVRAVSRICEDQNVEPAIYAHASAGCLHIRPILDLRTEDHIRAMRNISTETIQISLEYGGAVSGEHGDGLARSEWLEKAFGPEIMAAHRMLKTAADPHEILNPGKIIDAPPMDQNLRFGSDYRSQGWKPVFSFEHQNSLQNAIEMCNGAGVCRKDGGVMCPSFQVTRDEMHSTRGRANLLRALISGKHRAVDYQSADDQRPRGEITVEDVLSALDLCLACKGCKSECPSAVDMAKLKYEFMEHYYRTHRHKLRDYLFGYFGTFVKFGAPFGYLINWVLGQRFVNTAFAWMLGLSPQRQLPAFNRLNVHSRPRGRDHQEDAAIETNQAKPTVLFLFDDFTKYFHPKAGEAALQVLQSSGYQVKVIPVSGAGRTLISKGFLTAAKRHAKELVAAITELDPVGQLPIVGVEPSEIYTLSDEYPDFFPADETVTTIAKRSWMIDEFIIRNGNLKINIPKSSVKVLLHGHCYQKARPPADDGLPTGVEATVMMLKNAGYEMEVIDSGCCGMAGSFGYEAEHFETSLQIGELALFPAVRKAGEDVIIVASGVSCQAQIEDGTSRKVIHPIHLVAALMDETG